MQFDAQSASKAVLIETMQVLRRVPRQNRDRRRLGSRLALSKPGTRRHSRRGFGGFTSCPWRRGVQINSQTAYGRWIHSPNKAHQIFFSGKLEV